jgi:hypothetical protein
VTKERKKKRTWLCAAKLQLGLAHRTVRCARLVFGKMAALGKRISGVRLKFTKLSGGAPDCPVSQRSPKQQSATQSSRDTWTAPTVSCCTGLSGAPISPEEQWSDMPNLEGDRAPDSLQDLSCGALDCPLRHSTEGKDSLPC